MSIAKYSLTAIDCPDPVELAAFYSQITGLEMEPLGDISKDSVHWYELLHHGVGMIAFQRVADYLPPTWPQGPIPQQVHLDFQVQDLDEAELQVLAIGARIAAPSDGKNFRVYLDPVGHPFCFVLEEEREVILESLAAEVTSNRI